MWNIGRNEGSGEALYFINIPTMNKESDTWW